MTAKAATASAERYQAILEAAERVIAESGFARAQVSRIAREAGVAGGTVYLYFESKNDLLVSLFRERFQAFLAELDGTLAQAETAAQALAGLVRTHLAALAERPHMAVVTQIELRQADPDIRRGIQAVLSPYLDRIADVLARGARDGSFARDLDVRLAKKMVFGTLDQCVTAWVMSGRKYDLAGLAPGLTGLLLHGLAGPGGSRAAAREGRGG
ncbi:MAG: TetR/AcrR family transcriptional regulator [Clostridia bacterium]|nr:TetR/AcrR family transcriptional regulator [Clostridia bacterium]